MSAADTWPVGGSLFPLRRPADQPRRLPRLLYVDQNAETLIAFTALLAMSGYLPLSMQNPFAALGMARSTTLNVAVLNYDLPMMNGLELAHQIRQARPALPIVLLCDQSSITHKLTAAVNYALPKDRDLNQLLRNINRCLGSDIAA